jgi:two-component system, chemotaxis family, chemotaxis protein CheY
MTKDAACRTRNGSVLIVDDSGLARIRLKRFLLDQGFSGVLEAADGDEALRLFGEHRPRTVLLDQVMRGREGLDTARLMLAADPDVQIIMFTAVTDRHLHQRALSVGIQRVLQKMDLEALASSLRELGYE